MARADLGFSTTPRYFNGLAIIAQTCCRAARTLAGVRGFKSSFERVAL
jgi:hypothetical protein